ncbi:MAG: 23S rRNA (guanosine(2251)-2'-O)-methyltransferase RlmB [Blastocatellia bacterium]|nr:23S rRNA (guanosine(2251)-2'-O)-methyltransferase RlmB [Blastocatellia bacterium]MDQ3221373.1 23S rRNA (guanosine(2251)-2'-O)-methyltransferase RlmB [Acidobacteriota bacterium]
MRSKFKVQGSKFKAESPKSKVQIPKSKVEAGRKEKGFREVRSSPHPSSLIFGVSPVLEALRANSRRIDKIVIAEGAKERRLQEIVELARQNNVLIIRVSRDSLSKLVADGANHQGVAAYTASGNYLATEEILDGIEANALLVVLDGVEDPRNLGAILRTVECAGADGVFIPERRAVGLTDTVAKSSAGAVEHVKVSKVANLNRLIEELKERNIWVVGTSGNAGMSYTEWDWKQPTALVLGGEGSGLHRLVAENCDVLVKIPMYGRIESLNVSVAAGVVLFEAVRQRVRSSKFKVPSSDRASHFELETRNSELET